MSDQRNLFCSQIEVSFKWCLFLLLKDNGIRAGISDNTPHYIMQSETLQRVNTHFVTPMTTIVPFSLKCSAKPLEP